MSEPMSNKENEITDPSTSPVKQKISEQADTPIKRKPLISANHHEPISPSKETPRRSGRVIGALHHEIDELKEEVIKLKLTNDEYRKGNEILKKRRDQLVEQLSNSKHEVDTVNSLLQRKQRRISDIEEQLGEITSSNDDLGFKFKNLQLKMNKVQENESTVTSEYERLKIAYDTVVASQKEYRDFYSNEIKILKDKLSCYIEQKEAMFNKNITLITKSDNTIHRALKSVNLRTMELEEETESRNMKFEEKLSALSTLSKKSIDDDLNLLEFLKTLTDRIAEELHLDKAEILKKFLDEDRSRTNPFHLTSRTYKDDKEEPISGLKIIKKRNEKNFVKAAPSSSGTEENRILQLNKTLNASIPQKHRTMSNVKIVPKSYSRQASGVLGNGSRRNSAKIESLNVEETTADESSKKKKRRRRKKRNGRDDTSAGVVIDEDSEDDEDPDITKAQPKV